MRSILMLLWEAAERGTESDEAALFDQYDTVAEPDSDT